MSRKKRERLKEVDENDLKVSLAHDDVSMTGQEGDSLGGPYSYIFFFLFIRSNIFQPSLKIIFLISSFRPKIILNYYIKRSFKDQYSY